MVVWILTLRSASFLLCKTKTLISSGIFAGKGSVTTVSLEKNFPSLNPQGSFLYFLHVLEVDNLTKLWSSGFLYLSGNNAWTIWSTKATCSSLLYLATHRKQCTWLWTFCTDSIILILSLMEHQWQFLWKKTPTQYWKCLATRTGLFFSKWHLSW